MNVDAETVLAAQRLILREDFTRLSSVVTDGISVGAALELACCHWMYRTDGNGPAAALVRAWSDRHAVLRDAIVALDHRGVRPVGDDVVFGAPRFEVCPVPLADQWQDDQWVMFQDRFRRTLVANGFPPRLATAMSRAMAEMSDNVTQHSGPDRSQQANGVVAFHGAERRMAFAVADVGRGVLNSLRTNPRWASLQSSGDALVVAVNDGATSRVEEAQGEGFRIVLNALADLNGHLRFRSGGGSFTLDGGGEARQSVKSFVPETVGFQLSVTCSLDAADFEMFL